MMRRMDVWSQSVVISSLLSLVWVNAAIAQPHQKSSPLVAQELSQFLPQQVPTTDQQVAQQDTLTQAEIYDLGTRVQLQPRDQSARSATLGDVLVPLDSLQTAAASGSFAELLFNEGSIARVDQNTTFFFRQGLRRFQLPNLVALNETIFMLENGAAVIMSPPNSTGTQVETPEALINIIAPDSVASRPPDGQQDPVQVAWNVMAWDSRAKSAIREAFDLRLSQLDEGTEPGSSELLLPPERSSVVMVVHDAEQNSTRVFALTDGDITVSDLAGENSVALIGGQTVAVTDGQLGQVQEFDLENFYRTVPLVEGLGPGQEDLVAQEPAAVQITLNAVRVETLAAVRRQAREREGFTNTFLQDALNGIDAGFPDPTRGVNDRDFNGQRGQPNVVIRQDPGSPVDGTFRDNSSDDSRVRATFTPDNDPDNPVEIEGDIDTRSVTIDGESGRANNVGISGDTAAGEVILDNGQIIRIEVFDVGGEPPDTDRNYRGRIIRGVTPDY